MRTNKFSKVIEYSIYIQKSIEFQYSDTQQSETEIYKTTILFSIAPKKIRFLGMNLSSIVYLHDENYKMLMKKSKKS